MNVTIPLDDELSAFIEGKVAGGHYASSSDVVRDALQLLRSLDASGAYTTEELRAAWQAGIDSGDAGEIDFEELKKEARGLFAR